MYFLRRYVFLFLILSFGILLSACSDNEEAPGDENHEERNIAVQALEDDKEEDTEPEITSPTTGFEIDDEKNKGFTTMIENSQASRPHTGLVDADVVYEVEVEGGETRFLGVYHDNIPEGIGPTRSSRHYFIPFAEAWGTPYVHFGGSPQAYDKLSSISIPAIDGIETETTYFQRDDTRRAPHNAYLQTKTLDNVLEGEYKVESNPHTDFVHTEDVDSGEKVDSLTVNYQSTNNVTYEYNEGEYKRYMNGEPHVDRATEEVVSANHVIVLYANHAAIPGDNSGRIDVDLSSSGNADIFTYDDNGESKYVSGTWENKDGNVEVLVGGDKARLKPGTTWFQIVRNDDRHTVDYNLVENKN